MPIDADKNLAAEIGRKISKMKPSKGGAGGDAFERAAGDVFDAIEGESRDAFQIALKDAIKACLAGHKPEGGEGAPERKGDGEDSGSERY